MLFWFTESLFSPLIADTKPTIWRGGKKKNKTKQTKPKEEREALASALWNSSHTPPSLSFVPLSVMLRNQRPLKSALMRPKRHSSLLSPLPWSFWRSGFGSHTHTHTHSPINTVRQGPGALGVSVWCQQQCWFLRLEDFWNFLVACELAWLLLLDLFFWIFFFFSFFHFSVSMRSKQVMSLEPPASSSAVPQGLLSGVQTALGLI